MTDKVNAKYFPCHSGAFEKCDRIPQYRCKVLNAKGKVQNAKDKTIPPFLLKQIHLPSLKGGQIIINAPIRRLSGILGGFACGFACGKLWLKRGA